MQGLSGCGRGRLEQPAKSAAARPLTADEIVMSQMRKRQAASALSKGAPSKVMRLDNNSFMEAAAARRRQGPGRHSLAVSFSSAL